MFWADRMSQVVFLVLLVFLRKLKEWYAGLVVSHPAVGVNQEEMLAFARAYDPQWFHTDVERAKEGRWDGLIASGWLTCSIAMRMAVDAALHDYESFGSPGLEKLDRTRTRLKSSH